MWISTISIDMKLSYSSSLDWTPYVVSSQYDNCWKLQASLVCSQDQLWKQFRLFAFVILQVMTRGKFHSVPHRAVVNKSKPRLSIGNFLTPNRTMEIISPPDLPTPAEQPDTRPEYRPFTFAEYVKHKFSKQPGRAFVRYSMQQKGASTLVA